MENLSIEELKEINGGWNLVEYIVMGVGYIHAYANNPRNHAGQESISVYTNGTPWP